MVFWGIEVKPGKPYTHSFEGGRGRLRISQATLAIGSATLKSLVQCNVGDKRPVLLCALLPNKTESLQLDLEFEEAEDVIFSVIGPRGIYLTGYYVGHNRQSNMQDDSESFGEDIANSETQESNHCSDEDEYDDSFINDDEPEPLTPSPVSSSRDDDDDGDFLKKKNGNGGRKRLKKKYQTIVSDDEISAPKIDDEDDSPISSICKNNKPEASGKKTNKVRSVELDKETKNNDDKYKSDAVNTEILDSKDKVDVHLVGDETKGIGDQPNASMSSLDEVATESRSKPKKKREGSSKKDRAIGASSVNQSNALKGDKAQQTEANINNINNKSLLEVVATDLNRGSSMPHDSFLPSAQVSSNEVKAKKKRKDHNKKGNAVKADAESHVDSLKEKGHQSKAESNFADHDVLATKDGQKANDMGVGHSLEVLASAEVVPEKNLKPKKKRKGHSEVNTDGTDGNLLAGNKQEDDQLAINKSYVNDSNQSEEKEGKKKRRKTSKTQEVEENTNIEIEKENRKTLSNGLVIEDLVTGNSEGKVAASGRKVKVQYVVKLKESGQVIDSNGKVPHKFRLGDEGVIEGLNVGLDGMRVGGKRRLTIPPSMSLGYKGTGENVPPNSWLVYDVEMNSIH